MRIVDITKTFNRAGTNYEAGKSFVMPEDIESQFRSVAGDCMGMSHPIEPVYKKYNGEDLSGKKLIVWRQGGVGDIYFLSSALCYIKRRYPTCTLRVATGCREPLENLPEIDQLLSMPFDAKLLEDSDYHLMFQGIIESSSEKSKNTHAADMFFSYFNIDSTHLPPEDKKPKTVFSETEMKWLDEECKKLSVAPEDYVVGIQMETSAPLRNYPKEKFKIIIDVMSKESNVKIFLIGSPQQNTVAGYLKGNASNVIIATNYDVRKSIVLVNRYNLVISPDSFMVQAAGALDKPLIGIYGPFSSEVRMKYFKNAIGLEPKVVCSPCYKHDFRSCIKGFPSPCFSLVNPEDILEAANYLRKKFGGGNFNYMAPVLKDPDLSEIEKYLLSVDKGLCFFGGYFKHDNMIRVDINKFVGADITDLNHNFDRAKYPFVLFMNNFGMQNGSVYSNSKEFVRPGGYFISYKIDCNEQIFLDLKRDLGRSYVVLYSKFDPATRVGIIVGRKPY
jgi:ADP-heptose:LPS heptosyltransferase